MLKLYWLPTVNGAIELSKRNSSEAIVLLDTAAPYELGTPTNMSAVYPAYVRGQAYLLAHDGYAAAVEFQKLLDHRGVVQNFVTGSLAHLQLGRSLHRRHRSCSDISPRSKGKALRDRARG